MRHGTRFVRKAEQMKKNIMKKYADLIVRIGANVQKGQAVIVHMDVDQGEFAALIADACYKAGASRVDFEWSYQPLTKLDYRYQTLTELSKVPEWKKQKLQLMVDENPCRIYIESEDPDGLKGVNRAKMQKARMKRYPILKPYNDAMENQYQWVIAAIPSFAWAKKVFPDEKKHQAYEHLWEAILATVRVTEDNDQIEAWKQHNADFEARCKWLNDHRFDTISYKSSNGTDFRVGMIPEGRFCGGGETSLRGTFFNPNLPTEEIFISPKKGIAEGTLVATKPLSYQGQLIDRFSITFHEGKAVSWEAPEGQKEILDRMLTMDEGAAYLGEIALVPESSPISQSGILFYNTLFDENASCHVALGRGFMDTIDDFEHKTLEECRALGVNDSMIHVDFMVGAPDLAITGWKDGVPTPIFVNGEWAAEV